MDQHSVRGDERSFHATLWPDRGDLESMLRTLLSESGDEHSVEASELSERIDERLVDGDRPCAILAPTTVSRLGPTSVSPFGPTPSVTLDRPPSVALDRHRQTPWTYFAGVYFASACSQALTASADCGATAFPSSTTSRVVNRLPQNFWLAS